MKILLVTPKYLPYLCGNTFTAERISRGLKKLSLKVQIATPKDYEKIRRRFEPDIIHFFHASKSYIENIDKPTIVTLTGTDVSKGLEDKSQVAIMKKVLKRAKHVTGFHKHNITKALKKLKITGKKTTVIHPAPYLQPTEFNFRNYLGLQETDIVFLLPASIRDIKDPLFAVEELAPLQAKNPNIKLIILGETEDEELAQKIKAFGNWIMITKVPHAYMQRAYEQSNIMLNTSKSEGFANSVIEVMSVNKLILAADIPGNKTIPKKYLFKKKKGELMKLAKKYLKKQPTPKYAALPDMIAEAKLYRDIYERVI